MKNYSYPRVVTSVTALQRSSARPAPEDTTVLFVPIIANKGPEKELVKIHSLEEFRSIFGLDTRMGLTLLNISNWLTAGGTIYAYRLVGATGAKEPSCRNTDTSNNDAILINIKGKYIGTAINGYKVDLEIINNKNLLVIVKDKNNVVRERLSVPISSLVDDSNNPKQLTISEKSEYLSEIFIRFIKDGNNYKLKYYEDSSASSVDALKGKLTLKDGSDNLPLPESVQVQGQPADISSSYEAALFKFWSNRGTNTECMKAIGNPLETPIDLIMDAGYPLSIKKEMIEAISHVDSTTDEVDAIRPDIRGIFDLGNVTTNIPEDSSLTESTTVSALFKENNKKAYTKTSNIFLFAQHIIISEEAYFDKDMKVYPSYFLSKLIPANDLLNGMQFPVAGKRRGEIEGVKKISYNPDPDTKEAWFKARVNYIEKDSRGYYFMSQRTFDGSSEEAYNALSFMNNSRVTCRMVNDLQRLGRDYLFEFNDAVTLANMSAVLNRYVSNWIANRTLSFGNVVVSADPYSDERVNAVLNIKFTGTIEVISIDLILQ